MTATLAQFALVNDAVAATAKKLQKHAILGEYLRAMEADDDLRRAVRYCGGRAFASTDERNANVGGATFGDVVVNRLKLSPADWHAAVVRHGEAGEALAAVWPGNGRVGDASPPGTQADASGGTGASPVHFSPAESDEDRNHGRGARATGGNASPLLLADLAAAFDELAATGNGARKREILDALLARVAGPREAAYVAKVIFGDLRTGVQEGVLQAAVASAFGAALKDVQRCQLLVGDLDAVAVLARHGQLETAWFRLFHPLQFMLATPQEAAADAAATLAGRAFFAEDKLDGIRAQVHKQGDGPDARVAIYTRTMDRADVSFPDVVESVRGLPGEFLLDGEIVPYAGGRVLPFAHIQKRLGRKALSATILRDNPARFVAFDVLYKDGELLMDKPLRERRAALEGMAGADSIATSFSPPGGQTFLSVSPPGSSSASADGGRDRQECLSPERGGEESPSAANTPPELGVAPLARAPGHPALLITQATLVSTEAEIDRSFCTARDCRNEGLILKDPDSPYAPGRRGKMWLKLKTHLPTFDCVVTAAEYGHGKRRNSLSDYTFAVWDREPAEPGAKLVNVGKAFSGVTDIEIAQLTELFLSIQTARFGRVFAVKPQVVLEIACDQIQRSARHASGYALRFPRIKRVRWDKRPEDADRLARFVEVYESAANFAKGEADTNAAPAAEPTLFDGM